MEALFENFNPLFEGRSDNWDLDLRNFLEFYLQELHNETSCSSKINFTHAAIVLQKSAFVYEKKVDYLWQLVMQLSDVLKLSRTSAESVTSNDGTPKQLPVQENVEACSSKKSHGRKTRSNKPYLLEEFSQINNKVSAKSLDLPSTDKSTSKPQFMLTRSAVFGRMVNIKKKRQHELYVFDKNEECMGKKDDFRLSWSLNHCCTLIEDPSVESIENPPPVSERLSVPMDCDRIGGLLPPVSPMSGAGCAEDDPAPNPGSNPGSPNQEVPSEQSPSQVPNENQEVPQGPPNHEALNENQNQEVPDAQNVATQSEVAPSQSFALPDTPPDSQGVQDGAVVNGVMAVLSTPAQEIAVQEEPGTRRSMRERNTLLPGDKFNPLNYLFSSSLLQSLDNSADGGNTSMRDQAITNRRKGKRRRQEILEEGGDLIGFEEEPAEGREEPGVPAASLGQDSNSEIRHLEVPQMNDPVPTPPPTPSNSQAMSPGLVSRTPRSDLTGIPFRRFPELTEEPINMFDPYRTDEIEENDRSARVAAWHKSIKQRLDEANARPPFDVHVYGSKVINSFPSLRSTLPFKDLVNGMDKPEIARVFLTSLMLANTENVEISIRDSSRLPVDCMSLTLLSTQRHEKELEAFCAPSVDIQRRSNTESPELGTSSGSNQNKRKQDKSDNSRCIPHKKARALL